MIRNLKALGLAMAALFAVSAVAASAAQAAPAHFVAAAENPMDTVYFTATQDDQDSPLQKFTTENGISLQGAALHAWGSERAVRQLPRHLCKALPRQREPEGAERPAPRPEAEVVEQALQEVAAQAQGPS